MSDVLDDVAAMPPPAPPAIGDALERELGSIAPVAMRRPLRQLAILVVLSLLYGAGLVAFLTIRDDMVELPMGWLAAVGVGWLFGFIVPSYLALMPRKGTMMPRWPIAAVAAVVTSVAFVSLGLAVHPMGEHSLTYGVDRFAHGHSCLELGLLASFVPVVIGAIFLRGALPVGSRWIAAALGAGGGCLGGLVLHLHCRVADGLHVGLIHGGVVVVAALLSAAIVPRATR
ncbi:MAG: NrsF family protein [Kofleriaceae bacterium]